MDFLNSELRFNFQQQFGGSFYFTVPDNIFVYDDDENIYLADIKKAPEMAEQSIKMNRNLFLLNETLNFNPEKTI